MIAQHWRLHTGADRQLRYYTIQKPWDLCLQSLMIGPLHLVYINRSQNTASFFLELFLHWSPVAYWAPTNLGSSSSRVLSFCLFMLFMGFSRQEYWSGLPFPSPMDHILWEFSTMICLSWVALHGMAHSFIKLDKAVVHVISLISSLIAVFILSSLWWIRIRGLWKLPDGRDWLRGKLVCNFSAFQTNLPTEFSQTSWNISKI